MTAAYAWLQAKVKLKPRNNGALIDDASRRNLEI